MFNYILEHNYDLARTGMDEPLQSLMLFLLHEFFSFIELSRRLDRSTVQNIFLTFESKKRSIKYATP